MNNVSKNNLVSVLTLFFLSVIEDLSGWDTIIRGYKWASSVMSYVFSSVKRRHNTCAVEDVAGDVRTLSRLEYCLNIGKHILPGDRTA